GAVLEHRDDAILVDRIEHFAGFIFKDLFVGSDRHSRRAHQEGANQEQENQPIRSEAHEPTRLTYSTGLDRDPTARRGRGTGSGSRSCPGGLTSARQKDPALRSAPAHHIWRTSLSTPTRRSHSSSQGRWTSPARTRFAIQLPGTAACRPWHRLSLPSERPRCSSGQSRCRTPRFPPPPRPSPQGRTRARLGRGSVAFPRYP